MGPQYYFLQYRVLDNNLQFNTCQLGHWSYNNSNKFEEQYLTHGRLYTKPSCMIACKKSSQVSFSVFAALVGLSSKDLRGLDGCHTSAALATI